jgi:hypothetical protein
MVFLLNFKNYNRLGQVKIHFITTDFFHKSRDMDIFPMRLKNGYFLKGPFFH